MCLISLNTYDVNDLNELSIPLKATLLMYFVLFITQSENVIDVSIALD